MRTQYKQFRITSTFLGDKLWSADDKMQNYNNHLVTIVNTETHKKTAFEFWGSIMKPEITTENELMFAFYCFLSDGEGSRYGFEEFCSEFGYDTDSRKAYKTFKACEKSLKKAERIGIDENMACDIMNDLQENYGCQEVDTMISIDMWYGDKHTEADKIDASFYPNDGEYKGNIYKNGKIIGDYSCNDSVELENTFSQLKFNW